jgi:hypothetical protein
MVQTLTGCATREWSISNACGRRPAPLGHFADPAGLLRTCNTASFPDLAYVRDWVPLSCRMRSRISRPRPAARPKTHCPRHGPPLFLHPGLAPNPSPASFPRRLRSRPKQTLLLPRPHYADRRHSACHRLPGLHSQTAAYPVTERPRTKLSPNIQFCTLIQLLGPTNWPLPSHPCLPSLSPVVPAACSRYCFRFADPPMIVA